MIAVIFQNSKLSLILLAYSKVFVSQDILKFLLMILLLLSPEC